MPPAIHRTSNRNKADSAVPASNNTKATSEGKPRGKHVREAEETVTEPEHAPAKKARVVSENSDTQPNLRRSGRSPKPNGKVAGARRKRRTKAEMEAARAATEEAKKQKEEAAKEANRRMAQMDIDDDFSRARTVAKTVRRISDIAMNNASDLEGEEFIGFNEVSSTSADESESEDLNISIFICFHN